MIYECLTCNRQYLYSDGKTFSEEIDSKEEVFYHGEPVSHGYCSMHCFEHWLKHDSELPKSDIEKILNEVR